MAKKLSLKERLAQKRAEGSLSTTGKIKKPISKEAFAKKQEELRLAEEERLRKEKQERLEAEKRRKEIERIAALEAARKKAAADAEYKAQKRILELEKEKEMIKAISGETNAGDPERPKIEYIILVASVFFAFVVAYTLGRTFMNRKAKNDSVVMAKKALAIFEKTDKVLDNYERYLRNHTADQIDFGTVKVLAKEGETFLKNDEFARFPTYGASFYAFGNTVGKNMLKYNRLYTNLIEQSIRIKTFLSNPKTRKILESVNNVKNIIKITPKTKVVVLNGNFSPKDIREIVAINIYDKDKMDMVVKQGLLAKYSGVATEEEKKARTRAKKRKLVRASSARLVKITLLGDPDRGEIVLPIAYLTPVTGASEFFQTTKLEYVQFQESYRSIKSTWKTLNEVRKSIKEDLNKKTHTPLLGMAF